MFVHTPFDKTDLRDVVLVVGDSHTYGHGLPDRNWYTDENGVNHGNSKSIADGQPASQFCWASQLQKEYPRLNVVNLARPGKDTLSMFGSVLEFVEMAKDRKIKTIIFNPSYDDRMQVAGIEGYDHKIWPCWVNDNTVDRKKWDIIKSTPGVSYWSPHWPSKSDSATGAWKDYEKAKDAFASYLYHPVTGALNTFACTHAALNIAQSLGADFYWSAAESTFLRSGGKVYQTKQLKAQQIPFIYDIVSREAKKALQAAGNPNPSFQEMHDPKKTVWLAADRHPSLAAHALYYREVIRPLFT